MSEKKVINGIELTKVSAEDAIKPLQDFNNKHHSVGNVDLDSNDQNDGVDGQRRTEIKKNQA